MILATSELVKIADSVVESLNLSEIRGASIDLAIGETALIPKGGVIDLFENELDLDSMFEPVELAKGYDLKPNSYIYASTAEKITIPQDMCALLLPRSSFARAGLILPMSMYANPGYHGHLPVVIYNASPFTFRIPPYYRIMQMFLIELKGKALEYGKQLDAKYHDEQPNTTPCFDDFDFEEVLKKLKKYE